MALQTQLRENSKSAQYTGGKTGKSDSVKGAPGTPNAATPKTTKSVTPKSTLPVKTGKSGAGTSNSASSNTVSVEAALGTATPKTSKSKSTMPDTQLTDEFTDSDRRMYLSPKTDAQTTERSRIRKLEQTLSEVVEDVSRLKKKIRQLTENSLTTTPYNYKDLSNDTQSVSQQGENSGSSGTEIIEQFNGHTMSALRSAVAHLSADSHREVVKTLTLKMFKTEELKTHSISGKRSVKSDETSPRPGLDNKRLEVLESLVREKCPNITHKNIVERLQNLQKVLRRQ